MFFVFDNAIMKISFSVSYYGLQTSKAGKDFEEQKKQYLYIPRETFI